DVSRGCGEVAELDLNPPRSPGPAAHQLALELELLAGPADPQARVWTPAELEALARGDVEDRGPTDEAAAPDQIDGPGEQGLARRIDLAAAQGDRGEALGHADQRGLGRGLELEDRHAVGPAVAGDRRL